LRASGAAAILDNVTRLLPYLAALTAATALTACGSSTATTTDSTPTSTPSSATQGTATAPTTPTQTGSSVPAGRAAGGPVPPGFDPVSFTAISDQEFWLLGTAPCSHPVCTSIVRTIDGGRHFVGIPAPVAPLASGTNAGVAQLRFANPRDGFAGPAGFQADSLWETHDGGEHWRVGLPKVVTFTVSHDHVYALTATCANGTCSHLALAVSPAPADRWTPTALPAGSSSGAPALTAYGSSLWLSLTPAAGTPRSQVLIYSADGGRTLQTRTSPCTPGLGGDLEASSAEVVWAVCPTGMMAQAWRSTDAGAHWQSLRVGQAGLSNGARIAPASDQAAVIAAGGIGPVYRTSDGGITFSTVEPPSPNGPSWEWLGFTDSMTGSALRAGAGAAVNGIAPHELWRSSDGGTHWSGPVPIR
jgi:photosystem II stability/assembly factor-like uncharacterized protein